MPKKNKKPRKLRKSVTTRAETSTASDTTSTDSATSVKTAKAGFIQRLYENEGAGLERLLRFAPLFIGAWIASGLVLDNPSLFIASSLAVLLAYNLGQGRMFHSIPFPEFARLILYVVLVVCLVGVGILSVHIAFTLLVAALTLLTYLTELLSEQSKELRSHTVLLLVASRMAEMSIGGLVGVYSQVITPEMQLHWEYLVLGFVPASTLAAAVIARHSEVFIQAGWKRQRIVQEKVRPGSLSQWYSLLALAGPAVPVILVPLGIFPAPFLLVILAYTKVPVLCQSFLEQREPDRLISLRTLTVAALLTMGVGTAAVLSRYM